MNVYCDSRPSSSAGFLLLGFLDGRPGVCLMPPRSQEVAASFGVVRTFVKTPG
jgi:hypothetical protein